MFDIGFWEITVIMVIALLVLGPERLPRLARTLGHWVGRARRVAADLRAELDRELHTEDLKRQIKDSGLGELRQLGQQARDIRKDLQSSAITPPSADKPGAPSAQPQDPQPEAEEPVKRDSKPGNGV